MIPPAPPMPDAVAENLAIQRQSKLQAVREKLGQLFSSKNSDPLGTYANHAEELDKHGRLDALNGGKEEI